MVLGRMAARVLARPRADTAYCLVAWRGGPAAGRKQPAGSALLDAHGGVLAVARTVWVAIPRPERTFTFDADHPAVLVGHDHGPTPVEFVLHALAACLTAGLANIAAARKVRLTEVRSTVTGDIDLNGILGLDPEVRNGYQQLTVRFTIKGDAPAHKLRELLEQSQARSAVYDVITNQVPVTIEVDTP
jgi:uncharacterized OsmC-like protein